ncbi:MAG: tRNA (guanosine(37)-N1)-methyltransferase TrmD [Carbonactinosporaceae bacterium]
MRIDVVTIFPGYLEPLGVSLLGKARDRGLLRVHVHDLRDWATDVHRTVDDTPYGGGPGMVMKPEPWGRALDDLVPRDAPAPRLVVPTPSGRAYTQEVAVELSREPWLVVACGRYEGIDQRVTDDARARMPVDELSIGDYVLAGGEAAALVIVESVTRLLPGVVGNAGSTGDDSFAPGAMAGLLEGPAYTKPSRWRDREVPAVLLSGDHAEISRWRRERALLRTAALRPDLVERLDATVLDARDRSVLASAGWVQRGGRFFRATEDVAD